jgi:hypothetical protein
VLRTGAAACLLQKEGEAGTRELISAHDSFQSIA